VDAQAFALQDARATAANQITSLIGIVPVIMFSVTSSGSGSLVIDSITAGGKIDAPVSQRVFWTSFEGLAAIAILLGGGLASLQAAATSTGPPIAIVLVLMCISNFVGLRKEKRA
jgi:betaine/carnitine transporter, BCCT family